MNISGHIKAAAEAALGRPFSWGRDNCGLWPANIIRDATGVDYAGPLRGTYKTERGAVLRLRRFAAGGLPEAVEKIARANGWRRLSLDEDRGPGDIGVCGSGASAFLLIFDGAQWVGREDRGVGYFPPDLDGVCAWRLPCLQ